MADKKAIEKAQKAIKKKADTRPFFKTMPGQFVMVFIAVAAIVFLPTTIILVIGMMPTIAAMMVNFRGNMAKAYSIAATNFVGCFVFILDLWSSGHDFDRSIEIVTNPITIVTMYSAASLGYLLDWTLSGMVASLMQQHAKSRLVSIKQRQQDLIDQWGQKVTGNVALDEDGFPFKK